MEPIQLAEIGGFHIGGRAVTLSGLPVREVVFSPGAPAKLVDGDGDFETGQMYVQFARLVQPRALHPLLLWHGGGMTGVTWETIPDGRPGWQSYFLRAGHDVYVSDAVERGRASWSRFPEIYAGEPHFRSKREAWELFRFGPPGSYATEPSARRPYPGQLFPVAHFDQFARQIVPRWATNDAPTQAAYEALVRKIGPCVIVTHSQGGNFGFRTALNAPDLVRAVIAIEPAGAPDPARESLAALTRVPHLIVAGDYMAGDPFWSQIMRNIRRYRDTLAAQGGEATLLDLPASGIAGNSHMPMMDANSDLVAGLIQDWMRRQGLLR